MVFSILRGLWAVVRDPANHLTDDELKVYLRERKLPERVMGNKRLMRRFAR